MSLVQSLPFDKWSTVRDATRRDWPKYAYFYYYLNKLIAWKNEDTLVKDDIYCLNSNVESGVYLCIRKNKRTMYLFAFEESKNLLEELLWKTNEITWSESFSFYVIHESIQDKLEDFLNNQAKIKGLKHYAKNKFACYLKDKNDCLNTIIEIPEECELKRIEEQHVPIIHSHWHRRNIKHPEKSIFYLSTLVKLNPSYGLFMKEDKSLVSWILQCNRGCLAILNTLEQHRRKGYGKIVAQALAKYLAEKDDKDVIVYVDDYNVTGMKFFQSMGFKHIANLAWYDINQ